MILLLHALETGDISRIRRVEQAYAIFKELQDNHVHKLASLAVEKISWGLEKLRKSMEGSGPRHRDSTTGMQEAGQNEARRNPEGRRDTVMGNTGMFSLEEPGLQSFTSEAFAPLTWSSAGAELAISPLVQLKQEQESPPRQVVKPLSRKKARDLDKSGPIAGVLDDRSRRSPPEPAPDHFGAAISQEHAQLQGGGTVSAPPKCSAVRQHHGRYEDIASERHLRQPTYLPYPSHHNSPTFEFSDRGWEQGRHESGGAIRGRRQTPPMKEPNRPAMLSPQLRHNSCPLLHKPSVAATLPRPTFSSCTVQKEDESMGSKHTDIHIPWADAAAPTGQSMGHGMLLIPMAMQDQSLPVYQHAVPQHHQQHMGYQYPYVGHLSGPTSISLTAADVEQMTVGEWRRWMGSSGAM
jgi:hypothetical protein